MPFTINDSYTFLLADTLTGTVLTDLPMSSVSFTRQLNGAGEFSATIPVVAQTQRLQLVDATRPGIRSIYILRNNVPVYGGIIWGRQYNRADKTVAINGSGWESWFTRRILKKSVHYIQIDQLNIFRDLVYRARNEGWNGFVNIGDVDPDTGLTNTARTDTNFVMEIDATVSGVLRDRHWYGYDLETYGARMQMLSAVMNGFDWMIRTERIGTTFVRRLVFGYPYYGASEFTTPLVFEFPGNLVDYSTTEDAGEAATSVAISGQGDEAAKLMLESARVWSEQFANAGWPLLESVQTADNVIVKSTLNDHLNKWERKLAPPVLVTEATARGYTYPEVGTYEPGDYALFRIDDDFTGRIISQKRRIHSYTVTVPDSGTEETVQFNLAEDENARAEEISPDNPVTPDEQDPAGPPVEETPEGVDEV